MGYEKVVATSRDLSKCSKCHILGHIMTSKVCPLRDSELLSQSTITSELPSQSAKVSNPTLDPNTILDSCSIVVESIVPKSISQLLTDSSLPPLVLSYRLPSPEPSCLPPRYDCLEAIYQRYVTARSA